MHLHLQHANLIGIIFFSCADELNLISRLDRAVDNLEICNDSSERIEHRVKDKGLERRIRITLRCWHSLYDCIKNLLDTLTGLT